MAATARIVFRPICSNCNNQIYELINCEENTVQIDGNKSRILFDKYYTITPTSCPYCGAYFTSIEMPGSVPFDNCLSLSARTEEDTI